MAFIHHVRITVNHYKTMRRILPVPMPKIYTNAQFLLCLILLVTVSSLSQGQELKALEKKEGILVKEGKQKVLFYQKAINSLSGEYKKNHYIHPLYDLEGHVLTEDFPKDHLHQRGVFWAWPQVRLDGEKFTDMWTIRHFTWDIESVEIQRIGHKLLLKPEVYWRSSNLTDKEGNKIPFVKENSTITIHPSENDMRMIDFDIHIQALKADLDLGGSDNEKGYGGFSARIKLPENIKFIATYGEPEAKVTAVPASPWMDFVGSFNDPSSQSGLLILCHPSNPGFPPAWIIRDQGSMQNPVYPGKKPVAVSQSKPLMLRYRMVIHRNLIKRKTIDEMFMNYKQE